MTRPATVVDYDAIRRGYAPPTEHLLIDELAYHGMKVLFRTSIGQRGSLNVCCDVDLDYEIIEALQWFALQKLKEFTRTKPKRRKMVAEDLYRVYQMDKT